MTIAQYTGASETSPCSKCGTQVLHRESEALCADAKPWWMPEAHDAPCGLPCISGGVKPAQIRADGVHGYRDRCPKCGPLRVLPEVVQEMLGRAIDARGGASPGPFMLRDGWEQLEDEKGGLHIASRDGGLVYSYDSFPSRGDLELWAAAPSVVEDLLRCLDEITVLRSERDEAQEALSEQRHRADMLQMRVDDLEIAAEERSAATIAPPTGQPFRVVSSAETERAINALRSYADAGPYPERMMIHCDNVRDLLAHRDHLAAQVTELQRHSTAQVYRHRGALARCASKGREEHDLEGEHVATWQAGWDDAERLMKGT